MKKRPKVLWVAISDIDGEILVNKATGIPVIGTNQKVVKDEANNLSHLFELWKFRKVGA